MGELLRAVGHDQARGWLRAVVAAHRATGSYLFLGPHGIGKSSVALEFAAALRCENRPDGWSCGECNPCRRIARGVHPNVRCFTKPEDKAYFPVDLVREICGQAALTRYEPGRRVFIIADADRFNESSANAFLKTLEEPPADLILILLAGNAAQMLPTILSRCQVVRFRALNEQAMLEVTGDWASIPPGIERRRRLARIAQGSPGRMQLLAEAEVLESTDRFIEAVARDPFQAGEELAARISKPKSNEERRQLLREVLAVLSAALRDRMLAGLGIDEVEPLSGSHAAPGEATPDGLLQAIERLEQLRMRVDGNLNLKLCCDAIALAWPR